LRAIEDFERFCLGLLDELSLSEEILEKIDATVKVLQHELNEDSYLRVLHLWKESFRFLAENAFEELGIEQLCEKPSKSESKKALGSDWLKRFDIVESVTGYVLLDAEKRFRTQVLDTLQEALIGEFGFGEIVEVFKGSWASSLDGELISRRKSCNFILCENALITDTLYSPEITSIVREDLWIAPKNDRPLIFYIPFGLIGEVIAPSSLSYRMGRDAKAFDLEVKLRVEDGIEENRLPYVMNRLKILRHMVVFKEVDINIQIEREEDESEKRNTDWKSRVIHHIRQHANTSLSNEYSIASIVEGEARPPYATIPRWLLGLVPSRYF
jgi:hypothetical protein